MNLLITPRSEFNHIQQHFLVKHNEIEQHAFIYSSDSIRSKISPFLQTVHIKIKGSFFPSAVRLWNSLPASAISASTMDDFKVLASAGIPRR